MKLGSKMTDQMKTALCSPYQTRILQDARVSYHISTLFFHRKITGQSWDLHSPTPQVVKLQGAKITPAKKAQKCNYCCMKFETKRDCDEHIRTIHALQYAIDQTIGTET